MRRDKYRNNDPCNLLQMAISQLNLNQNMSALIRKRRSQVIVSSTICLHLVLGVTFLTLLSDPIPIIGNACHSLPNWLTPSRLVNLIDVTLAFEDANSNLVEVVTVGNDHAEDNVGNSLLQILELTFGPKAELLFRLWAQGLVEILRLKFRQDFEAGFCSAFCR